ncbi:MAG: glycoside hydrolase family 3 C-terminal domain-containing protein [Fibrobacterota bacterium]|nr:glycoside hydrolase family 3 C-terminal domain-containing protein [Fibrobacterota bacterium]QQS04759.1 MAG: glycoside hydrolase family 3 C-terminal domain-containing protein [Fibrobacterota bacterium]
MRVAKMCVIGWGLFHGAQAGVLQGTVVDPGGSPVSNAMVAYGESVVGAPRTLSDNQGRFRLESDLISSVGARPGGFRTGLVVTGSEQLRLRVLDLQGRVWRTELLSAGHGTWTLDNPSSAVTGLSSGVWVVELSGRSGSLRTLALANGLPQSAVRLLPGAAFPAMRQMSANSCQVRVRKTGYISQTLALAVADSNVTVVLEPDPVERRIDSVMTGLTLDDKVGQMTQGLVNGPYKSTLISANRLGSVLGGGGEAISTFDDLQADALRASAKIPVLYGIDAVHGHAKMQGAVVHPHNIGLGATGDTALVRRLGEMTAREMWAGQCDWAFAPCIAVPRDERWGRTYEGYGETPQLASAFGSAYIRGLQGGRFDSAFAVIACAKHFLGDGGTALNSSTQKGAILDQGNVTVSQAELDSVHLPGYVAAVDAGVQTVMASYSLFHGTRMHAHKALLTDTLKTNLGFDGFVVSDWLAIEQLDGTYEEQVAASINAGVDMGMEPRNEKVFPAALKSLVGSGKIPQSRIDDAVRRILRVKFRSGRMDAPVRRKAWDAQLGGAAHRAIAREAVQKSLVVLKNEGGILPLPKSGKNIVVSGIGADDAGIQCGGWTLGWMGKAGAVPGSTTIYQGLQAAAGAVVKKGTAANGDIALVFAHELPYAEVGGDTMDLAVDPSVLSNAKAAKAAGAKVVLVMIAGRPQILGELASLADAIVMAWLPGSEGAGVADVLFGTVAPTGKLPCSWPRSMAQIPINVGDASYDPLYPFGFGLTW